MAKGDVGPITEFGRTVARFAGEEIQKKVMAGSEGISQASAPQVAQWLKGALERLEASVDEKVGIQIMETCGFNCAEINRSHIERAMAKRARFETLEAFLEAEEKDPMPGTRLVREGAIVHQYYDPLSTFKQRCFCSLWRGLGEDADVPLIWCQCSKAFVMKLWEAYLGRPAQVELVESCIAGAKQCQFTIDLEG